MRKTIILIIILIVVGLVGYYIWTDFVKPKSGTGLFPDLDRPINTQDEMARNKIEELSSALKENKDLSSYWLDLASYRKLIGDYEAAIEIWEYMIVKWPEDYKAFLNLGNLYGYYLHDFSKAEEYFLEAIEKNPHYILSYISIYEFYIDTEKPDLAVGILLNGLEKNLNNVDLFSLLGKHYKDVNDLVNARKYYGMALDEVQKAGDVNMAEQFKEALGHVRDRKSEISDGSQ